MLFCLGMISFPADDSRSRRHDFLLNRTASYELDPISELPRALGFALCLEPRVFALELANIAERPEALKVPLTRGIAGGDGPHFKNSLGRKPSLFVSSPENFALELANIAERPEAHKPPSPEVSQVFLRSSTQSVAIWRQFPSHASTCFSLTTGKLAVLAAPAFLRSLSRSCSEAADATPHRCPWAHIEPVQVLARESHGAFFPPTAASASCKGNGRA